VVVVVGVGMVVCVVLTVSGAMFLCWTSLVLPVIIIRNSSPKVCRTELVLSTEGF